MLQLVLYYNITNMFKTNRHLKEFVEIYYLTIAKLAIDGRCLKPYVPETKYNDLRIAMDMRESISKNLNKVKNKVMQWIYKYYPEYKDVLGDWEGKTGLITLRKFPTYEEDFFKVI
jgi:hypothetical protein